jgi:hypothetical protein
MCKKKIWVQQENLYKITYCLRVFPTTPAARELEELFSAVLEKLLQSINAPGVYGT